MALTGCRGDEELPGAPRLGLFGGTFDPIHIGHLIVAEEARARLRLDRVIFVPARESPLKRTGTFFSAEDRLRMVELAIEGNLYLQASRADLDRVGPSYSVDTLHALRETYGSGAQFFFVMGLDSLATFGAWHRPEEIVRLARLAVISRPGVELDWGSLEAEISGIREATEIIDTLQIGISSTDIRERLRRGLPIRYQVPAAVEAHIRTLYVGLDAVRASAHPSHRATL